MLPRSITLKRLALRSLKTLGALELSEAGLDADALCTTLPLFGDVSGLLLGVVDKLFALFRPIFDGFGFLAFSLAGFVFKEVACANGVILRIFNCLVPV